MWAIAKYDLGLSDAEFWDELPHWMFQELLNRLNQEKRHVLIGHGVVASTLANINRGKGTRPFTPADFIPGEPRVQHQQSAEEQIAIFKSISKVVN
jgi:hypothetical protein